MSTIDLEYAFLPLMASYHRYVFDQIFSMNASQQEVFEKTAKPLLPGVLDGYNSTVFAYGVSYPALGVVPAADS